MHGQATIKSAQLFGTDVVDVDVEVSVTKGPDGFDIVGMADASASEARERVRAAIKRSGYELPRGRVLVNLAPAGVRKGGSGYDLAIAAGILAATEQVDPGALAGKMLVGELRLDGGVRPARGMYAFANRCEGSGGELGLVCSGLADELSAFEWATPVCGLQALGDIAKLPERPPVLPYEPQTVLDAPDFADIAGRAAAKRACQVAAAGKLGLMLVGPRGAGKAALAARIPSILPDMAEEKRAAALTARSAAGLVLDALIAGRRPFRAPHHSATPSGMLGGGRPVVPGEAPLAHGGVLFLDKAAEWSPATLQGLRAAVDDGRVRVDEADGTVELPSDFQLVMAAEPCPCGNFGGPGDCTCSHAAVRHYQDRIGGPLADKVDVWASVPLENPLEAGATQASAELREGVEAAWEFRAAHGGDIRHMPPRELSGQLDADARDFLERSSRQGALSGAQMLSAMRCARAIADIGQSEGVRREHVVEALGYRRF